MSYIALTKPVAVDSFPAFIIEFLVKYLNQDKDYSGVYYLLYDTFYSFYSQKELDKLKATTFEAVTIDNEVSPPLLIIGVYNHDNLPFKHFFEIAKETYQVIGLDLLSPSKFREIKSDYNNHVFFVATLTGKELNDNAGTLIALK